MAKKKKIRVPDSFDKVYASEPQIREIKEEISGLEKMLVMDKHGSQRISDEAGVRAEIEKKRGLLKKCAPKPLKGAASDRAYNEAKELAKQIKDAMPTGKQYFQRGAKDSDNHSKMMDFERAVKQQMEFQTNPEIQRKVKRYKAIMRNIDPADPTITNIENLRR